MDNLRKRTPIKTERIFSGGAKVSDDAQRVMGSMREENRPAFRNAVRKKIDRKATRGGKLDVGKRRKITTRSMEWREIFRDK